MDEKDKKSEDEDTEGQARRQVSPRDEDDTEGHGGSPPRGRGEQRAEVSAEGTEDDDTEGHARRQ